MFYVTDEECIRSIKVIEQKIDLPGNLKVLCALNKLVYRGHYIYSLGRKLVVKVLFHVF